MKIRGAQKKKKKKKGTHPIDLLYILAFLKGWKNEQRKAKQK
jgi:hypothetical protein